MGAHGLGGKVYFFGGYNSTLGYLTSVQIFDSTTWSWSVVHLPGFGRVYSDVSTDGRWLCSVTMGPGSQVDVLDTLSGQWRHTSTPGTAKRIATSAMPTRLQG